MTLKEVQIWELEQVEHTHKIVDYLKNKYSPVYLDGSKWLNKCTGSRQLSYTRNSKFHMSTFYSGGWSIISLSSLAGFLPKTKEWMMKKETAYFHRDVLCLQTQFQSRHGESIRKIQRDILLRNLSVNLRQIKVRRHNQNLRIFRTVRTKYSLETQLLTEIWYLKWALRTKASVKAYWGVIKYGV